MPIRNLMRYDPEIDKIKTEDDILELLMSVKMELSAVDPEAHLGQKSFKEVAEIVSLSKYYSKMQGTEVDLSKARDLLNRYKGLSGTGCGSCTEIREHHDAYERREYCGKYETKKDAINEHSPRIKEYWTNGCEDHARKLRPIEEVLGEQEMVDEVTELSE